MLRALWSAAQRKSCLSGDWVRKTAKKHGLGLKQPFPPNVVVVPNWVRYWADEAWEKRQAMKRRGEASGRPSCLMVCAAADYEPCRQTKSKMAAEAEKEAARAESEEKYKRKYETLKDEHETLKIENETLKDKYKTLKKEYKKHKSV
jgi:hypothetical protein